MVDKVNLLKLIDYALQPSKRERKETAENKGREEIRVSLSKAVHILESTNVEESDRKKVERIKEQLERGEYEINEEKIKEGLERFFL